MVIDSGFTHAVYGQHVDKHDEHRIHNIQTIHVNNEKLDKDVDTVRNIAADEEIYTYYGPDYFQDIEGRCPCRSCQPDVHAHHEAEEEECKLNIQRQEEIDKKTIKDK